MNGGIIEDRKPKRNKSPLSKQRLPRPVIDLLISFRHYAYVVLLPLDYAYRALNGKSDFPPLHLRRHVGPLRTFEASGAEFTTYLRLLTVLRPDERLLDVGCGCGLMAIFLKDHLHQSGRYVGVDIHKPSIGWCEKEIGSRHPNFTFEHIDVRNRAFNPNGANPAEAYRFPFDDQSFDIILLKSVFTHMRPVEVENYVKEISRMLRPAGRCLMTFFLLNAEQARLSSQGDQELDFNYGDGVWRYVYEQRPESAVAFAEENIRDLLKRCGLVLQEPIYYGKWSGRIDGLSYQDIIIVRKED